MENLKITYDCHKPEIIYTGVDNESGDLIFKAEENGDVKRKIHCYCFINTIFSDILVKEE